MQEHIYNINDKDFGEIEIKQSRKYRTLKIIISVKTLSITMSPEYSIKSAINFLEEKRNVIKIKQNKITNSYSRKTFLIDETNPLSTLTFNVKVEPYDKEKILFHWNNNKELIIKYPLNKDCHTKEMQKAFCNGIAYFLKKEAHKILPKRLKELAEIKGFKYKSLKIQSSKTRWGSCSNKKSINLSIYLLVLPQKLIDYVIIHELCHTIEMNHGSNFWALLSEKCGEDAKKLSKEINKYNMPIV